MVPIAEKYNTYRFADQGEGDRLVEAGDHGEGSTGTHLHPPRQVQAKD